MLNNKIKLINNTTEENEPTNKRSITTLMEAISSNNAKCTINNPKLKVLHMQIDRIMLDYKQIYRGLITTEIKSNNLNIAAEAIKERNDLIESIYSTVKTEMAKQVSK